MTNNTIFLPHKKKYIKTSTLQQFQPNQHNSNPKKTSHLTRPIKPKTHSSAIFVDNIPRRHRPLRPFGMSIIETRPVQEWRAKKAAATGFGAHRGRHCRDSPDRFGHNRFYNARLRSRSVAFIMSDGRCVCARKDGESFYGGNCEDSVHIFDL